MLVEYQPTSCKLDSEPSERLGLDPGMPWPVYSSQVRGWICRPLSQDPM